MDYNPPDLIGIQIRMVATTDWWDKGDIATITERVGARLWEADFENEKNWCIYLQDFEILEDPAPVQLTLF